MINSCCLTTKNKNGWILNFWNPTILNFVTTGLLMRFEPVISGTHFYS